MNILGTHLAPLLQADDVVLDLGCGILGPWGGRPPVPRYVAVDGFAAYLDRISAHAMTVTGTLPQAAQQFTSKSYDVVLLLDVIEHLEKADAKLVLAEAARIARRLVIVYTPDGYVTQPSISPWGMGINSLQAHRCGFSADELGAAGYPAHIFEPLGGLLSCRYMQ